jgi:hypothetical protein
MSRYLPPVIIFFVADWVIFCFQRHYRQLKEELTKLKAPPGLEDLAVEPEVASTSGTGDLSTVAEDPSTPRLDLITPSATSTPISAPTTPPTPTPSSPMGQSSEAPPPYEASCDPELVQHV